MITAHGNGLQTLTACASLLSLSGRGPKQQDSKMSPHPSPSRKTDRSNEQHIGSIKVIVQATENDLGKVNWLVIPRPPWEYFKISAPFPEVSLYRILSSIFENTNYPPSFDTSAITQYILDNSIEGQQGRRNLLRCFRLFNKDLYDSEVNARIRDSVFGQQNKYGNVVYCSTLQQGPDLDSFLFSERIVSMITTIFNEEYFSINYPS